MVAHNDRLLDFGYILKAKPTGYPGGLGVDCGKKKRVKDTLKLVQPEQLEGQSCYLLQMEKAIGGVGFGAKTKDPVLEILSFRYQKSL